MKYADIEHLFAEVVNTNDRRNFVEKLSGSTKREPFYFQNILYFLFYSTFLLRILSTHRAP